MHGIQECGDIQIRFKCLKVDFQFCIEVCCSLAWPQCQSEIDSIELVISGGLSIHFKFQSQTSSKQMFPITEWPDPLFEM